MILLMDEQGKGIAADNMGLAVQLARKGHEVVPQGLIGINSGKQLEISKP